MMTSSTPWPRSQSSMKAMNGRSTSGTTGLGTREVSGRSRVPSPPARMRACTGRALAGAVARGAPDRLVDEAGGARGVGVDEVAAVDEQRAAHGLARRREVELPELRPLGHEHD